jgi:hypothetical protein
MTMVYLANVPSIETHRGLEFYSPHAHVAVDWPMQGNPNYFVLVHCGAGSSRDFARFDHAMDYASRCLKQSEPA